MVLSERPREAVALGALGTMLVAALVLACLFPRGTGPLTAGVGPAPTPGPTYSTSDDPVATADLEQRLTRVIALMMRKAMPDATFIPNRLDQPTRAAFEAIADGHGRIEASADVRDPLGTGNVLVVLSRASGAFTTCPDDAGSTCGQSTGPHGENIVAIYDFLGDAGGSTMYRVDVTKVDGTQIVIQAQNWGQLGATGKVSAPTRPLPPITVATMVTIACEPALSLPA